LIVTVMNALMASTKKNTATAPDRSPLFYGPVSPGTVTTWAATCLPSSVSHAD